MTILKRIWKRLFCKRSPAKLIKLIKDLEKQVVDNDNKSEILRKKLSSAVDCNTKQALFIELLILDSESKILYEKIEALAKEEGIM